ncbi:MAG: signal peptidase II [Gammaproteobacteria bacterium]|nr:signal peptidase II [Gammaproteobacteria bacterium]
MSIQLKDKLPRNNWGWLYASVAVLMADQISKALVTHRLAPYQAQALLPHLNLITMHNTGAAFSMFAQAPALVFLVLAAAVSAGILYWLHRNPHGQHLLAAGFSLILGGALSNALDRVTRGFVVDFIDFYIGHWHFAAFNLADAAITAGAGLLIMDMLLQARSSRSG